MGGGGGEGGGGREGGGGKAVTSIRIDLEPHGSLCGQSLMVLWEYMIRE